jgi:anthranilate synthase component 1
MIPHYKKFICDTETPVSLYEKITRRAEYAFLLESAESHKVTGRYSVIGFDPLFLEIFPAGGDKNPLEILQKKYESIDYTPNSELPLMQAPFVGYFSYEVARHFENLDLPVKNAKIPEGIFFFPKNLLVFDHFEHTITLIAYTENDLADLIKQFENIKENSNPSRLQTQSTQVNKISNADAGRAFENLVSTAKESIYAGEVFQIVLSQEFHQETKEKPFDLYRRLRLISPSPYMYYLQYPDFSVIGSSPETLVKTEGDEVIIRPIAGTRRRGVVPKEDEALAEELKNDLKEQAEHMMLVDLGRNDIGRVSEVGSIKITKLMEVEKYSHVMHLVSEIRGKRRKDKSLFDIFKTAFPAGTLSGAPKIRAMEIIAKLENSPRDIYGGAVGYFDLSGNMDFAIAIRTMLYKKGCVSMRAGAGIVYDSVPEYENKECLNKARGPLSIFKNQ